MKALAVMEKQNILVAKPWRARPDVMIVSTESSVDMGLDRDADNDDGRFPYMLCKEWHERERTAPSN